jgi:hypothetical protein
MQRPVRVSLEACSVTKLADIRDPPETVSVVILAEEAN